MDFISACECLSWGKSGTFGGLTRICTGRVQSGWTKVEIPTFAENSAAKMGHPLPVLLACVHDCRGIAWSFLCGSRRAALSVLHKIEEGLVDAAVVGEFGVEGGGHGASLPDGDGVGAFGSNHFHTGADAGDFWGADEDHFERRFSEQALGDGGAGLRPEAV